MAPADGCYHITCQDYQVILSYYSVTVAKSD